MYRFTYRLRGDTAARTLLLLLSLSLLLSCSLCPGNSTRYRVLVGKDDTAGDYYTIEVLIRAQAYGYIRGRYQQQQQL